MEKQIVQKEEEKKPLSIVEEAAKIRDEIKAENDRRERFLAEEQKLHAEKMLGSTAGQPQEQQAPKEETPKEYAEKVMNGQVKPQ